MSDEGKVEEAEGETPSILRSETPPETPEEPVVDVEGVPEEESPEESPEAAVEPPETVVETVPEENRRVEPGYDAHAPAWGSREPNSGW